jgi:uncharacterized protein (DUF2267 family)
MQDNKEPYTLICAVLYCSSKSLQASQLQHKAAQLPEAA